jgi:hypothetical protein
LTLKPAVQLEFCLVAIAHLDTGAGAEQSSLRGIQAYLHYWPRLALVLPFELVPTKLQCQIKFCKIKNAEPAQLFRALGSLPIDHAIPSLRILRTLPQEPLSNIVNSSDRPLR